MKVVQQLEGAVVVEVSSNLREYGLRFDVLDENVAAVEIDGLGAPLHIGPAGGTHRVVHEGGAHAPRRHTLSYRIRYVSGAAGASPGVPFRISAQAM